VCCDSDVLNSLSGLWVRWNSLTYWKLTTTVLSTLSGCCSDSQRLRTHLDVSGLAGQFSRVKHARQCWKLAKLFLIFFHLQSKPSSLDHGSVVWCHEDFAEAKTFRFRRCSGFRDTETHSVSLAAFMLWNDWTATCKQSFSNMEIFGGVAADQHPSYLHLATSEMWCWSGGLGILRKLTLWYSIVYCYNGAQRYEQFLQVGWLDRAWFSSLPSKHLCIFNHYDAIYIVKKIFFTSFSLSFSKLSLVGLAFDLVD